MVGSPKGRLPSGDADWLLVWAGGMVGCTVSSLVDVGWYGKTTLLATCDVVGVGGILDITDSPLLRWATGEINGTVVEKALASALETKASAFAMGGIFTGQRLHVSAVGGK